MRYGIRRRKERFGFGSSHTWCRAYKGYKQPIAWDTDDYMNRGRRILMSKAAAVKLMRELQAKDSKHDYKLYEAG
jgi:hypothetical protein